MSWERVLTTRNIERLLVGDLFTKGEPGGLLLTLIIGSLFVKETKNVDIRSDTLAHH